MGHAPVYSSWRVGIRLITCGVYVDRLVDESGISNYYPDRGVPLSQPRASHLGLAPCMGPDGLRHIPAIRL